MRRHIPSPSRSAASASSSSAGSTARGSPRSARPWTASSRVSGSGSASRSASASRSSSVSCGGEHAERERRPVADVAVLVAREPDQCADGRRGAAARERDRGRLADARVAVGGQPQQRVEPEVLAEVAEAVGDRLEHAGVLLARGHRLQRGGRLGREGAHGRAELAEQERGDPALERVAVLRHRAARGTAPPRRRGRRAPTAYGAHSASEVHSPRARSSSSSNERPGSAGSRK